VGPLIKVTLAPLKLASLAMDIPMMPLLGLLMNRTGSRCSLVGPAVTTNLFPFRSFPLKQKVLYEGGEELKARVVGLIAHKVRRHYLYPHGVQLTYCLPHLR